jgi:DNA-binding LacI/PurR family transcriptional regulator
MKATIRQRVAGARVRGTVPPAYRTKAVKDIRSDGQYTVVLCGHNERNVVSSPELARAFRRLATPASDGIIVVGTVFTEEAKALADEQGARIVALRASKWTDESARQRQL